MKNYLKPSIVLLISFGFTLPVFAAKGGKRSGSPGQEQQKPKSDSDTSPTPAASQPSSTDGSTARKSQSDLQAAMAAAKSKYESDPAWTAAATDLKQAQTENDAAVTPVMAALKADPGYKAAAAELAKDEAKLADIRSGNSPDASAMSDVASNAMAARAKIRSLETSAISADPAASAAVTKLKGAVDAMTAIRVGEAKAIAADPDVVSAKQAVEASKPAAPSASK